MEVYNGPHLIIKYEAENSRLINTWKSSPTNDVAYRKELMIYSMATQQIKIDLIKNVMTFTKVLGTGKRDMKSCQPLAGKG